MKILLSAYACEPYQGSEPGIGWNWALELARKGYEVYVLTRLNNKKSIEDFFVNNEENLNIYFLYYDLPTVLVRAKKIMGIYIYYNFWQIGACVKLKREFGKNFFSIVHHITFGSFRFPSYMYILGGKFIIGPVGGGEQSGKTLIKTLPALYQIREYSRNIINYLNRFNALANISYRKSKLIIATTEETAQQFSHHLKKKIIVRTAIGLNVDSERKNLSRTSANTYNILYAGMLSHWKGIHLAVLAFSSFKNKFPEATLTIVGKGSFANELTKLVKKEGLANSVNFVKWCSQNELWKYYAKCDVFLFPSFHDSGGFVVLEAMSFAKPVICLDSGAPGLFVGDSPNVVKSNQTPEAIIANISMRLTALISNRDEYLVESERVVTRVKLFRWENTVNNVYDSIISID